jgi:hypothetical protein
MRSVISLVVPTVLLAAAFAGAPELPAQAIEEQSVNATAVQIGALSRARADRWVRTAPIIHCTPAPLTERPGAAGELGRPRLAPLEAAFLDALRARRTLAGARSSRP